MTNFRVIIFILIAFLLTSCFKTAADLQRERQADQASKLIAELTDEVNALKSGLANTSGQIQENDYKHTTTYNQQQEMMKQNINQLKEQVAVLNKENEENKDLIRGLLSDQKKQKKYIKDISNALNIKAGNSSSNGSTILKAHKAFEANKQALATSLYLQAINEGKINNAQKNGAYYNLGLLSYWSKKYKDALVYFSKVYTKYPKSTYAPRSLLYIARSFNKSGKAAEAKATYKELIAKYPTSSHAKTAKKELK